MLRARSLRTRVKVRASDWPTRRANDGDERLAARGVRGAARGLSAGGRAGAGPAFEGAARGVLPPLPLLRGVLPPLPFFEFCRLWRTVMLPKMFGMKGETPPVECRRLYTEYTHTINGSIEQKMIKRRQKGSVQYIQESKLSVSARTTSLEYATTDW